MQAGCWNRLLKMRRFGTSVGFKWFLLICSTCSFIYFIQNRSLEVLFRRPTTSSGLNDPSDNGTAQVDKELLADLALHLRDTAYDGVDNYIRFMTATLGLRRLPGVDPIVAGMGPVINDVGWFRYPINLAPCAVDDDSRLRSLFVGVVSAPHNFERRAMIRQTWPTHLRENPSLELAGFGFVVGLTNDSVVQEQVEEESHKFGDILQINMVDKYTNLSVKGAGLLNWVRTYCPRVDFVLKVDDDVYVNVHNLATVLVSLSPSQPSVYGHQCGGNIPDRRGGKWATSFDMWPWQRFPIYFQGAAVVIAGSAVRPILAAIQVTPYFTWEDLYLVGLCAVKAKVQLRTSNQIFVDMPASYADTCFVRNSVMWTTGSADAMNASHVVSHNFYQLPPKVHCIDQNQTNDEPANQTDFPFGTIQQN